MDGSNQHIRRAMELAEELRGLANDGETCCQDDSCAVLYAIIRDCAYKIHGRAEREMSQHLAEGRWEDDDDS